MFVATTNRTSEGGNGSECRPQSEICKATANRPRENPRYAKYLGYVNEDIEGNIKEGVAFTPQTEWRINKPHNAANRGVCDLQVSIPDQIPNMEIKI